MKMKEFNAITKRNSQKPRYKRKSAFNKEDSLALKGIAILMLIFHHLFFAKKVLNGSDIGVSILTTDRVTNVAIFFKICVSIFAFITGYGLTKSLLKIKDTEVKTWMQTRLIKSITMCWFTITVSLIIPELINHRASNFYFSKGISKGIIRLISTYLCLDNIFNQRLYIGSWWYLSAIVIFTILIPLIYYANKKIGALTTLFLVIIISRVIKIDDLGGSNNPLSFLLIVAIGVLFSYYNVFEWLENQSWKKMGKIIEFIVNTVLVILCYKLYHAICTTTWWEIYWGIIPVFIIIYTVKYIIRMPILTKILQIFGKHSLSIFLTHAFIRVVYLKEFIYGQKNFIVMYVLTTVLSLLLAIIIDESKKVLSKLLHSIRIKKIN